MAQEKPKLFPILLFLLITALVLGGTLVLFLSLSGPGQALAFGEKIGVVTLTGPITDSQQLLSELLEFKRDGSIKAIILRIDSPGGAVGPSQEIYREVRRTTEAKPVVASLGSVAASGGYYSAAGASRIVANPGTITGSIGVIMEFFRFKGLLDKIGLQLEVLKTGEFKDIGSPNRELTDRDREIIGHLMGDIQEQFVSDVAQGRNLPFEKVAEIADGRVVSGAKAKELGLVDELGNFQDAVHLAQELAHIPGDPVLVYPKRSQFNIFDLLTESALKSLSRVLANSASRVSYRWEGLPALPFTRTD